MAVSQANDGRGLELAGRLLGRLRTDAQFAQNFHADPASAMQEEFPELRNVSKDEILEKIRAGARLSPGAPVVVAGFLSEIASAAASAAAAAAVGALVGAAAREPTPE